MKITINEVSLELPEGSTLPDALDAKDIKPQGIATALNGAVVPAILRPSKKLADGDSIVIIKAFYGG